MRVAIALFPRNTALDAIGPYEVLQRVVRDEAMLEWIREVHRSTLVDRQAAQASQLMIEYDPQPPFDSGDLAKASEATRLLALEYFARRD